MPMVTSTISQIQNAALRGQAEVWSREFSVEVWRDEAQEVEVVVCRGAGRTAIARPGDLPLYVDEVNVDKVFEAERALLEGVGVSDCRCSRKRRSVLSDEDVKVLWDVVEILNQHIGPHVGRGLVEARGKVADVIRHAGACEVI